MKRRKRCEYHTVTSCMFRKMKIGLFLSLFAFSQIQAENLFAQSRTISISVNNEPVEQVIEKIEKNSDYVFLYNDKSIDLSRRVSVKVNGALSVVSDSEAAPYQPLNVYASPVADVFVGVGI